MPALFKGYPLHHRVMGEGAPSSVWRVMICGGMTVLVFPCWIFSVSVGVVSYSWGNKDCVDFGLRKAH